MNNLDKALRNYLKLPFTTILRRDEDGDVVAQIKELDGCIAHGEDEMDALNALESMKTLWITSALKRGDAIPTPESSEPLPSGKWLQRVPRSLHKKLVELAKEDEVSLNQLVTSILSEAAGAKRNATLPLPGVIPNLEASYGASDSRKNVVVFRSPKLVSDAAEKSATTHPEAGSAADFLTEERYLETLSKMLPTHLTQGLGGNQEIPSRGARENKTEKRYAY